MDMINTLLQPIAGVIGIFAYIVLGFKIWRTKIEQSFVAFMLWAMLDTIATTTTILEGGNYWLPLGNAVGASCVTFLLVFKKIAWSWIETMTAILVIVCLITWYVAGGAAGIIASSLAMVIAGIPQMVDTYNKPWVTPTGIYVTFTIANVLSFIAGKAWTIEERFYPACAVFLCLMIVIFSMRKVLKSMPV